MLTIFNGRRRQPTKDELAVYIQLDTALRDHLHKFWNGRNGNACLVFLAIGLHADEYGWAWPSVDLLKRETGISRDETITAALHHLLDMTINGAPVLKIYRRAIGGRRGGNVYHLFPQAGGDPPHLDGTLTLIERGTDEPALEDEPGTDQPQEPGTADPSQLNQNQSEPEPPIAAGAAAALAPLDVTVPQSTSGKLRDTYTERCQECGEPEGLVQELDECRACGRPIIWHGSKIADRRHKGQARQAADERAKARREQETYLSPLCAEVLALARADSAGEKHGARIGFNRETKEEPRLREYELSLGKDTLRTLMHQARARARGRGMIVALLRSCEAYVPPAAKRGHTPSLYDKKFD